MNKLSWGVLPAIIMSFLSMNVFADGCDDLVVTIRNDLPYPLMYAVKQEKFNGIGEIPYHAERYPQSYDEKPATKWQIIYNNTLAMNASSSVTLNNHGSSPYVIGFFSFWVNANGMTDKILNIELIKEYNGHATAESELRYGGIYVYLRGDKSPGSPKIASKLTTSLSHDYVYSLEKLYSGDCAINAPASVTLVIHAKTP